MRYNIFTSKWTPTGQTVQTPQFTKDITIQWKDRDGVEHEHTETVLFPNILNQVPTEWVQEEIDDLLVRALAKKLGVN